MLPVGLHNVDGDYVDDDGNGDGRIAPRHSIQKGKLMPLVP